MWTGGMLGALLGLVALLGVIPVQGAPDYIFTMSRGIEAGKGTDACLQLKDFHFPDQDGPDYRIFLRLEYKRKWSSDPDDNESFAILLKFSLPDKKKCIKTKGPRTVRYHTDTYDVTAIADVIYTNTAGEDVNTQLFNRSSEIKVFKTQDVTLVQTDKPIYKPGQTVQFRVMTLDEEFIPDSSAYPEISIESPNGMRVRQWKDVSVISKGGLASLKMPLSEDPLLGTWKIKVSVQDGNDVEQTFKVDEYVLPKYEVTVNPPKYLTPTTNQVTGSVCAKYTYGQPVKGSLSMKVCYTQYWYHRYRYDEDSNERPCINILEDIDGCYDFAVDADAMGLANNTYNLYGQLKIEANVTEQGTGVMLSGESTGPSISTNPITIRLESKTDYFKSSFPFHAKVIVTTPDGAPAIGEEIMVSASYAKRSSYVKEYEKIFMTDSEGVIDFTIPDLPEGIGNLRVEATSTTYKQTHGGPYPYFYSYRHSYYVSDASMIVRQWYTPSESYIYIEDNPTPLECGTKHDIDVFYTTDDTTAHEFQILVKSGEQTTVMDPVVDGYDGDLVDLNLMGVDPQKVLDKYVPPPTEEPPSPPPPPSTFTPDLYEGEYDGAEPVDEETIVPELFQPLGSSEARKKRSTTPMIGHFKYTIDIEPSMSPGVKVLIHYIRDDGEIVAATTDLKIQNCFVHKTGMSFDKETARPGEKVELNLNAEPESQCFVGMVDKSVNLLGGKGSMLSPEKVYERVKAYNSRRLWHSTWQEDREYCRSMKEDPDDTETYNHYRYEPVGADANEAFRDMGMWIITDGKVMHRPCQEQTYTYYHPVAMSRTDFMGGPESAIADLDGARGPGSPQPKGKSPSSQVEPRSFFPETWLWDMHNIGDDGTTSIQTKIPDTITEWVGNAFCIHYSLGLGVTPITGITAFKPFFVSLTMPYSVVRGETLPLKVTVFNYLDKCLTMGLYVVETEGIKLGGGPQSRQFCLCGGQSHTETYLVTPTIIGEVDIEATAVSLKDYGLCNNVIISEEYNDVSDGVQRQLTVEAEGVNQDLTQSSFMCVKEGEELQLSMDIDFPPNLVEGSETAKMAAMGDIMGPTLSGLKNLLRMPYGCGEQNMASWAPNPLVMGYLKATNQLTKKLKTDAKTYMLSGYQRQMNYRHHDNSYSAFGDNEWRNSTGSSWLTAFVVKVMSKSGKYVTIDPKDIEKSVTFLIGTQDPITGCFPRVGKVFSSYMKGGLGSDGENPAGLTAFILIALIDTDIDSDSLIESVGRGFECLDSFVVTEVDTYTLSVMLFAYTKHSRTTPRSNHILQELSKRKQTVDGHTYWRREQQEVEPDTPNWYWRRAAGADVEMTGYVLLAKLETFVLGDDMSEITSIVQWLTQQRNSYGGFSSTQDTVIAIQALSEFAKLTYSDKFSEVSVKFEGKRLSKEFTINQDNALVYQEHGFKPRKGAIQATVSGEGCALIQMNLKFNIHEDLDQGPAFDVQVRAMRSSLAKDNCAMRQLEICTSYMKRGGASNMAIAEVKMLTGWVPVVSTLKDLVKSGEIQKYEIDKSYVQLYYDQILATRDCVTFEVEQEIRMTSKPGKVRVYDYYEKEYTVTRPYEIKTTCGTKEEIPLDNKGLDCSIMQCRVTDGPPIDPKPEKFMSCPVCHDDMSSKKMIDSKALPELFCEAEVVYKTVVGRKGRFPIKVKSNIWPKKKESMNSFLKVVMSPDCTCESLFPGAEEKALIFSKQYVLNKETDSLVIGDETNVFPHHRKLEQAIRKLSGKGKLCKKLARQRRKAMERKARGQ